MPSMSFDLAPPALPPPPSRFGRVLRLVLLFAALNAFGLMTMRMVAPDLLDHTLESLAQ